MSTTQQTTGSNQSNLQFNPIAQSIYNQLISGGSNVLGGYMNAPFSNPAYTMGAAQGQRGAQQAGANNTAALQQNMLTSGMSGQAGAGFKQAQLAQTGRANQAMSSQANVQNVLSALQRQMAAAGTGLSFSPQLTGQSGSFSQQQTSSGLGSWLPQLMGGGLSAGLGLATGGASMAFNPANYAQQAFPGAGMVNGQMAPQLMNPGFAGEGSGGFTGQVPGGGGSGFNLVGNTPMPIFNPYFAGGGGGNG